MENKNKTSRRGFTLALPLLMGLAVGFALDSWALGIGIAAAFTAAWAAGRRKEDER